MLLLKRISCVLLLASVLATSAITVAATPEDDVYVDDPSIVDSTPIDTPSSEPDPYVPPDEPSYSEPESSYVEPEAPQSSEYYPDEYSEPDYNYDDTNDYYDDNYYDDYYESSVQEFYREPPVLDYTVPEVEEITLYDSDNRIDTSTLSEEDWKMALQFDQTAAGGAGDFSMIKNNKSGNNSNASIFMLFAGVALIAGACLIIIATIISYRNKSKKAAAYLGGVSKYNSAYSQTSPPKKRKKFSFRGETAEIDLPDSHKKKKK